MHSKCMRARLVCETVVGPKPDQPDPLAAAMGTGCGVAECCLILWPWLSDKITVVKTYGIMYNIYVNREKKFAIQLEPTQLTRVNEQSINRITLMIYLLCGSCVTHRMYVYKIGLASTVSSC